MKLIIERLGHLGDGIAPGPYFAARTLPGEEIEGRIEGDRVLDTRILTPAATRVRPPCPHYRSCGGCDLQHANDEFVADWKLGVVRSALAAQGLSDVVFRPVLTSPPASRRRAKLGGRRSKSGAIVGFYAPGSDVLIETGSCILLHPDLMAALPGLRALVSLGASRKGAVALTLTRSETGLDLAVAGGKPLDAALQQDLASLAQAHGIVRLSWEGEVVAQSVPPVQRFGPALVAPPPGAFLQATAEGEAALLAAVAEAVGPARRVADLFSGVGTFALPLAQRAEVHAVESEPDMLVALEKGWRQAAGLKRVTTEARDLFRRPLLGDELKRFDAVVIDPPRAGAEAQIAALAEAAQKPETTVPVVAAVSCNPVTFARDARALLAAGYRLDWVQVVDQFRWSPHVELAARFSR